ncbi:MAG: hypothetical protein N2645_08460 [Clostridia bacterium]|nr:hypothetical protein [Clostridia bacterium]
MQSLKKPVSYYFDRIDKIITEIEATSECKEVNKKIKQYFTEIQKYLPKDKKNLTVLIDDCITEMLIIYEKLYDSGFVDGISLYSNHSCKSYHSDFKSQPDIYNGNEKSDRSTKH